MGIKVSRRGGYPDSKSYIYLPNNSYLTIIPIPNETLIYQ